MEVWHQILVGGRDVRCILLVGAAGVGNNIYSTTGSNTGELSKLNLWHI